MIVSKLFNCITSIFRLSPYKFLPRLTHYNVYSTTDGKNPKCTNRTCPPLENTNSASQSSSQQVCITSTPKGEKPPVKICSNIASRKGSPNRYQKLKCKKTNGSSKFISKKCSSCAQQPKTRQSAHKKSTLQSPSCSKQIIQQVLSSDRKGAKSIIEIYKAGFSSFCGEPVQCGPCRVCKNKVCSCRPPPKFVKSAKCVTSKKSVCKQKQGKGKCGKKARSSSKSSRGTCSSGKSMSSYKQSETCGNKNCPNCTGKRKSGSSTSCKKKCPGSKRKSSCGSIKKKKAPSSCQICPKPKVSCGSPCKKSKSCSSSKRASSCSKKKRCKSSSSCSKKSKSCSSTKCKSSCSVRKPQSSPCKKVKSCVSSQRKSSPCQKKRKSSCTKKAPKRSSSKCSKTSCKSKSPCNKVCSKPRPSRSACSKKKANNCKPKCPKRSPCGSPSKQNPIIAAVKSEPGCLKIEIRLGDDSKPLKSKCSVAKKDGCKKPSSPCPKPKNKCPKTTSKCSMKKSKPEVCKKASKTKCKKKSCTSMKKSSCPKIQTRSRSASKSCSKNKGSDSTCKKTSGKKRTYPIDTFDRKYKGRLYPSCSSLTGKRSDRSKSPRSSRKRKRSSSCKKTSKSTKRSKSRNSSCCKKKKSYPTAVFDRRYTGRLYPSSTSLQKNTKSSSNSRSCSKRRSSSKKRCSSKRRRSSSKGKSCSSKSTSSLKGDDSAASCGTAKRKKKPFGKINPSKCTINKPKCGLHTSSSSSHLEMKPHTSPEDTLDSKQTSNKKYHSKTNLLNTSVQKIISNSGVSSLSSNQKGSEDPHVGRNSGPMKRSASTCFSSRKCSNHFEPCNKVRNGCRSTSKCIVCPPSSQSAWKVEAKGGQSSNSGSCSDQKPSCPKKCEEKPACPKKSCGEEKPSCKKPCAEQKPACKKTGFTPKAEPDIMCKISNIFRNGDKSEKEEIDKYFGKEYKTKEYHLYGKDSYADMMVHMKKDRLPQPSNKRKGTSKK